MADRGNRFEPLLRWYLVVAVAILLVGEYLENVVLQMIAGFLLAPVVLAAVIIVPWLLIQPRVKPEAAERRPNEPRKDSPSTL